MYQIPSYKVPPTKRRISTSASMKLVLLLVTIVLSDYFSHGAATDLGARLSKRLRAVAIKPISSGQANIRHMILVNKQLVIKRFHEQADFDNEVAVLKALKGCPHLLPPLFIIPELREIAFKRIPGGDLYHTDQLSNLSYGQLVNITTQLVTAIDFIHRVGYLHSDIKPENVLLDGSKIWLIDLGLARLLGEVGRGIGTKRTMAPEMFHPNAIWMPVTKAADWWSLGVTIFYLFSKWGSLDKQFHFGFFPYNVRDDLTLEWPPRAPPFNAPLLEVLLGSSGLLAFDYRCRSHNGTTLLAHPFFKGANE